MDKLRIAVCDDFKEIRDYIEFFCKKEKDIKCVASASNSVECLKMVKEHKPDILLLDIQMETDDAGLNIIPDLMDIHPKMKIIILTAHLEDDYIYSAFAMGASNYILKSMHFDEMLEIIHSVSNNHTVMIPEVAKVLANNGKMMKASLLYLINILVKLSPSEFDILKDIYDGNKYTEIAKKRYVSVSTVKNHALRILKKTGFHSIKELIEELRSLKILDLISDMKNI